MLVISGTLRGVSTARYPISAEPADWQRIAIAVRERRAELGLRQADAVERSGGRISLPVWSILENARQANGAMDRESLRGASAALDWPQDRLERMLAGEATTPAADERALALARLEAVERALVMVLEHLEVPVPPELRGATRAEP